MKASTKKHRIECFVNASIHIGNLNDNIVYLISKRLLISKSKLLRLIRERSVMANIKTKKF